MKNNNLKKRICKAINTECNKTDIKLIDTIMFYSQHLDTVNFSQAVLARMIGLKSKNSRIQVIRIINKFKRLNILKVISGKQTHETNEYIINPILFELAQDFKDILSACKQYLVDKATIILSENVTPYIINIYNRFFSSSSSSKRSFKTPFEPTVNPGAHWVQENEPTFGQYGYLKYDMGFDSNVGSVGLSDEEWEKVHRRPTKEEQVIERLTMPEAIEWAKWALRFGASDETDTVTAICQQDITPQSMGQNSYYHF